MMATMTFSKPLYEKAAKEFVPRSIAGVEKLIAEEGLLQTYGAIR